MKDNQIMIAAIQHILAETGDDPEREGLQRTPQRVAEMFQEIFAGYRVDPDEMRARSLFAAESDDLVLIRDITFYSMCEHHLLPFYGRVSVAYVPDGKIIGLSQVPRIVEMYARRLQVQERMTRQIADFLYAALRPQGVGVLVAGRHFCAMMRGVKKEEMRLVTSAMRGSFADGVRSHEVMELLRGP